MNLARNLTEEEYAHSWGNSTDLTRAAPEFSLALTCFSVVRKSCGWRTASAVPSIFVQSNNKRIKKGSGKGDKHDWSRGKLSYQGRLIRLEFFPLERREIKRTHKKGDEIINSLEGLIHTPLVIRWKTFRGSWQRNQIKLLLPASPRWLAAHLGSLSCVSFAFWGVNAENH